MIWPFDKREVHVHIASIDELRAGDSLVASIDPTWTPREIQQFVTFVKASALLPDGIRLLLIPSNCAPVVLRANPEPKGDKKATDGQE